MRDGRRLGANVILESEGGVILQLRDDLHRWGIFGGLVEEGEAPKKTAVREVEEELTIRLDPERLVFLKVFNGPRYKSYLFHYPVTAELDVAVLTEGIKFEAKSKGDLGPEEVVPWHWVMLEWYWEHGRHRAPREPGWDITS